MFRAATEYALEEKLPLIYLAANAGARVGLAQEVKQCLQVIFWAIPNAMLNHCACMNCISIRACSPCAGRVEQQQGSHKGLQIPVPVRCRLHLHCSAGRHCCPQGGALLCRKRCVAMQSAIREAALGVCASMPFDVILQKMHAEKHFNGIGSRISSKTGDGPLGSAWLYWQLQQCESQVLSGRHFLKGIAFSSD